MVQCGVGARLCRFLLLDHSWRCHIIALIDGCWSAGQVGRGLVGAFVLPEKVAAVQVGSAEGLVGGRGGVPLTQWLGGSLGSCGLKLARGKRGAC